MRGVDEVRLVRRLAPVAGHSRASSRGHVRKRPWALTPLPLSPSVSGTSALASCRSAHPFATDTAVFRFKPDEIQPLKGRQAATHVLKNLPSSPAAFC